MATRANASVRIRTRPSSRCRERTWLRRGAQIRATEVREPGAELRFADRRHGTHGRATGGWGRVLYRRRMRSSWIALCVLPLAACSRSRGAFPPAEAGTTKAIPVPVELVALVRDEAFTQAAWTSDDAVVAVSHRRFWWLRPQGEAITKTTVLGGEVDGMVTAEKADVSVVKSGRTVRVFQGATKGRAFDLGARNEELKSISSNGTVLVTGVPGSADSVGHAYDVHSGKRLADVWEHANLSDDGELALTFQGIVRSDTGAVVARFDSAGGQWIDGRAVNFSHRDGYSLVDPKNPAPKKLGSKCALSSAGEARGEDQQEHTSETDVVGKRVITFCRGTVEVVRLDDLFATTVKVTSRHPEAPRIRFALDGTILLVWEGGERPSAEAVDLYARTTRRLDVVPPHRDGSGKRVGAAGSVVSRDGTLQLVAKLSDALVVSEVATGRTRMRWGRARETGSSPEIVPFIHAGGLEIISEGDGGRERLRLGPLAPTLTGLPPLAPGAGCTGLRFPKLRSVTTTESRFEGFEGLACACTREGCTTVPRGVLAHAGDSALVEQKDGTAMFRMGGQQRLFDPEMFRDRGHVRTFSAAFVGDDALAILTRAGAEPAELTELAVPEMTTRQRRALPFDADRVTGTRATLFASRTFVGQLSGSLFARADAGQPVEVDAWPIGGIVRFPDGRVELFGQHAEDVFVCLDPDGTARPFASCRGQLEDKGRFRVD